MPDLFDNFFTSISAKLNGGHTKRHYSADSQVNTGKFYSYHNTASNNNYWLPRKASVSSVDDDAVKLEEDTNESGGGNFGAIDNEKKRRSASE
ncbi:hypothetical protein KGF56_000947 [Candida oxycetoniae]|uniref:Uncharacterized protein n=1 Tax=Candida oxycetoniae TaxID=497107 RepID=A0AAI9T0S9_9ASCO|nr:uncharacterized protein KGF56_000947 [Candida oxycetoniae]KAI3406106.2 hypothetical protein KGF56_000947 [Candida oxycetoniae]